MEKMLVSSFPSFVQTGLADGFPQHLGFLLHPVIQQSQTLHQLNALPEFFAATTGRPAACRCIYRYPFLGDGSTHCNLHKKATPRAIRHPTERLGGFETHPKTSWVASCLSYFYLFLKFEIYYKCCRIGKPSTIQYSNLLVSLTLWLPLRYEHANLTHMSCSYQSNLSMRSLHYVMSLKSLCLAGKTMVFQGFRVMCYLQKSSPVSQISCYLQLQRTFAW